MFMSISRKFLFLHDIQLSIFDWDLNHWDSEKLCSIKRSISAVFYLCNHVDICLDKIPYPSKAKATETKIAPDINPFWGHFKGHGLYGRSGDDRL